MNILLDNSYSPQEASEWLDAMYEDTQVVCQLAGYWECRAKISELNNDFFEAMALLDEGIACNAQVWKILFIFSDMGSNIYL